MRPKVWADKRYQPTDLSVGLCKKYKILTKKFWHPIIESNAFMWSYKVMSTMIAELYDALKDAGASEEKARAAAKTMADYDSRFNKIDQVCL